MEPPAAGIGLCTLDLLNVSGSGASRVGIHGDVQNPAGSPLEKP
jgi:hypothetical protein